jgi:acyl-CoA thioesterase YciA
MFMSDPKTGTLAIQTLAMPAHTNANGDIFGGWLVSQMDLAAGVIAKQFSRGRVVTIGIEKMAFHEPVHVGDVVSCFAHLIRSGTTSMTIKVETWCIHPVTGAERKVTGGEFTFVAIDDHGRKRNLPT